MPYQQLDALAAARQVDGNGQQNRYGSGQMILALAFAVAQHKGAIRQAQWVQRSTIPLEMLCAFALRYT